MHVSLCWWKFCYPLALLTIFHCYLPVYNPVNGWRYPWRSQHQASITAMGIFGRSALPMLRLTEPGAVSDVFAGCRPFNSVGHAVSEPIS